METMSKTYTSVSAEQNPKRKPGFSASEFFDARRGRADVAEVLDLTPAFIKKLSTVVQETRPSTASDYELYDDIDDGSYEDDEYLYEQYEPEQEATKRKCGRAALDRVLMAPKWLDRQASYYSAKFLTRASQEDREAHEAKYAPSEDDTWLRRRIKTIQRNKFNIYDRVIPYTLGALVMSKAMPFALDAGVDAAHDVSTKVSEAYTTIDDYFNKPRVITIESENAANAIDYTPVERQFDSKAIIIGGRGDTSGFVLFNALDAQNAIGDAQAHPVANPAGIAPVDPVRMDVSAEIAAQGAVNFYNPDSPGKQTIFGYSEGSAGAIDAYNRIVAENGGVKPENLELVLLGSPYAEGGFFKSDYAQVAGPVLDAMGIPVDKEVPAGATVIYSPNDFWANGDNQSFLGMMSQLADLGGSGHDPSVTGEFYEKIDGNGVRHLIKAGTEHALVELAQKHGMPLPDGTSEILQQIAPINNGFSDTPPQSNMYNAIAMTGDLIDRETHSNVGSAFMDNIPAPVQHVANSAVAAANEVPNLVTGMANGSIPLHEGLPQVQQHVEQTVHDVVEVVRDPVGMVQQYVNDAIPAAIPPEAQPFVQPFVDGGLDIFNKIAADIKQSLSQHR